MIKEDDNKKIAFISNQDYSSIVNQFIKAISNQFVFLFFYEKVLSLQKALKHKRFLPSFSCAQKTVAFVAFCSITFDLSVGFCLCRVFVRSKIFRKKKIKWFEIVLITPFTILLACSPLIPPIKNLFVHTYVHDNLQDFFT